MIAKIEDLRKRMARYERIRKDAKWLFKNAQTNQSPTEKYWGDLVDKCDAEIASTKAEVEELERQI